jgi:hypothetical protein
MITKLSSIKKIPHQISKPGQFRLFWQTCKLHQLYRKENEKKKNYEV